MRPKFNTIGYLRKGSKRQVSVYNTLIDKKIWLTLKDYDPILVGTIPINIDIGSSDLDIICCFSDKQEFYEVISINFCKERSFKIEEQLIFGSITIIANFFVNEFEIEIFGQHTPTKQQIAYRHMIIENDILRKYGENFRQEIIELKKQGFKTEPAFALALGLTGDPYVEILNYEN